MEAERKTYWCWNADESEPRQRPCLGDTPEKAATEWADVEYQSVDDNDDTTYSVGVAESKDGDQIAQFEVTFETVIKQSSKEVPFQEELA